VNYLKNHAAVYDVPIVTTAFCEMRWLVGVMTAALNLHSFVSVANEWNKFIIRLTISLRIGYTLFVVAVGLIL
jgi:hypothetical protein